MMSEADQLRVRRILLIATGNVSITDDPEHPFRVDGREPTDDEARVLRGLTITDLDDVRGHLILKRDLQDAAVWGQIFEAVNAECQRVCDFLAQQDDPPAPSA